jgi:hypothetical protein
LKEPPWQIVERRTLAAALVSGFYAQLRHRERPLVAAVVSGAAVHFGFVWDSALFMHRAAPNHPAVSSVADRVVPFGSLK